MPRYYFHLIEDGHRSADLDGSTFGSFELAFLDACRAAQDMSWEVATRGNDPAKFSFEITDEDGKPLAHVPFVEPAAGLSRASPDQGAALGRNLNRLNVRDPADAVSDRRRQVDRRNATRR